MHLRCATEITEQPRACLTQDCGLPATWLPGLLVKLRPAVALSGRPESSNCLMPCPAMRRPDVALPATAEHGPAARESLRIKCSGAAKNEVSSLLTLLALPLPHRVTVCCSAQGFTCGCELCRKDLGVSPTRGFEPLARPTAILQSLRPRRQSPTFCRSQSNPVKGPNT